MPLTLSRLTGQTVPATIRVKVPGEEGEGAKMNVVYRPGVLTPEWEQELHVFGTSGEGWAALISKLIVSWDLVGDDGEPVPIEYVPGRPGRPANGDDPGEPPTKGSGALMRLPGWLLQAVQNGVVEDLRPNSKTGETSGGSS